MSVDPLRTLVRRLRAAANSDDAQLSAALAAIPSAGTLRLYYFCRDHVQQAHLDYEPEGSSEYDLPPFPPEGSSRAAAQVTNIDLLDLQPDLLDARGISEPVASSAGLASSAKPLAAGVPSGSSGPVALGAPAGLLAADPPAVGVGVIFLCLP